MCVDVPVFYFFSSFDSSSSLCASLQYVFIKLSAGLHPSLFTVCSIGISPPVAPLCFIYTIVDIGRMNQPYINASLHLSWVTGWSGLQVPTLVFCGLSMALSVRNGSPIHRLNVSQFPVIETFRVWI